MRDDLELTGSIEAEVKYLKSQLSAANVKIERMREGIRSLLTDLHEAGAISKEVFDDALNDLTVLKGK
jgi:hypothetical protein